MKRHNGIISLWKFLFCLVILIFHVGEYAPDDQFVLLKYGSIGVEFFFIVSGYFMAMSAIKKNKEEQSVGEETFYYIWKKIKVFFPYIVITFILAILLKTAMNQMTLKTYVLSIWDLLMLKYVGFKSADAINHVWYITAMLISMAVLYPQIKKFGKNYFYLVAPITVIFIAGYMSQVYGNLRSPHTWVGFMYRGMPRAYFEICLGSLLYPIVEKLKKVDFTNFGRFVITLIELCGFISVVLVANYFGTFYDFVIVLVLFISIAFALSEKTLELKLLNNKFIYFLERMSLTVYLIHVPIRNMLAAYWTDTGVYINYWYQLIGIFTISLVLGVLMIWFVDYLKKHKFFIPVIKKIFIYEAENLV